MSWCLRRRRQRHRIGGTARRQAADNGRGNTIGSNVTVERYPSDPDIATAEPIAYLASMTGR